MATVKTLEEMLLEKKSASDEEQSEIKSVIQQLDAVTDQAHALQDRNVDYVILHSQLPQRCQTLLQSPSVLSSKPNKQHNASIRYIPRTEVTQSLQDLGKIEENVTDPSRCFIEIENDAIRCGVIHHFQLVTRNSEGHVCHTSKDFIDVRIQDADGIEVEKQLVQNENGYKVTYKAPVKPASQYLILVSIGGIAIKNSPMKVRTVDPKTHDFKLVMIFGKKIRKKHPIALAVNDTSGEILIVNQDPDGIIILNSDGTYLRQLGESGTGDGELCKPVEVVAYNNRVFVTDNSNDCGRLQEFDINGVYVRTIYKQKGITLYRMCLTDQNIAVLWQSIPDPVPVQIWQGGVTFYECGKPELVSAKSVLVKPKKQPGLMLFDKQSGNLVQMILLFNARLSFITHCNNKYFIPFEDHIGVYDENGDFLYQFGGHGKRDGQFVFCSGLHVYDCNTLLVCDSENHRVQVFTHEGEFITSFGGEGSGIRKMEYPQDVAVTPDGKVLVKEFNRSENSIQIWE